MVSRNARRRLKVALGEQMERSLASHPCGECTGCCTVLAIRELDKPMGVTCKHVGNSCCSIYDERPKSCRDYLCLWKFADGKPEERPDRIGVVITPTEPGSPGYPGLLVHELWPDAFSDAAAYLTHLARGLVLLLVRDGIPKSVMGPPNMIRGMKTQLEQIHRLNVEAREKKLAGGKI